jgi:hypothetical protein
MKKSVLVSSLVLPAFALPFLAFAARTGCSGASCPPNTLPTPIITQIGQLTSFICTAIDWLFTFFVILTILYIVIAAFRYLTSAGDPTRIDKANKTLLWAAVSIAIALVAKGIPLAIGSFFAASAGQTNSITQGC